MIGDTIVLQSAPQTVIGTVMLVTSNTSLTLTALAGATTGGTYGTRTAPGGLLDSVTIASGDTITLGSNETAAAVTLNDATSGTGSSALLLNGNALAVTGDLMLQPASSGSATTVVDVGSGTLTAGDVTIDAGSGSGSVSELRIGSGTAAVTGDVTFSGTAANARWTFTGTGSANLSGDFSEGGTLTPSTGATVSLIGTGPQSIGGYAYPTLSIDKLSGTATLSSDATVAEDLTITSGTLDLDTSGLDRTSAGGTLTIDPAAALEIGGTGTLPAGFTTHAIALLSTVAYDGADQTVAGVTYGNLTIDGTGTKMLDGDAAVADTLRMISGDIATDSHLLTVGTSPVVVGAVVRDTGSIIGCFRRWVGPVLASNILLPIGTATDYAGLDISYTVAPAAGGTVTACFDSTDPGTNGLPLVIDGHTINAVAPDGFWNVTAGDGLLGGVTTIDLSATAFGDIANASSLTLLYRPDDTTAWSAIDSASIGSSNVLSRLVSGSGITSYGQFGIGVEEDQTLPVTMAEFDGAWSDAGVLLNWRTASEVNNAGFVVSRAMSAEGPYAAIASYIEDGRLHGLGLSATGAQYTYLDDAGLRPRTRYYYRLSQVDIDGQVHEAGDPVMVMTGGGEDALGIRAFSRRLDVAPVPSVGPVTISFRSRTDGMATLDLFDRLGRLASSSPAEIHAGGNALPLDLSGLAAGVYMVRMEMQGESGYGTIVWGR